MNKKLQVLYAFILLAFFVSGCASSKPERSAIGAQYRIKGQIKNGAYSSPDKNFSCPLPDFVGPGTVVMDRSDRVQGGIMGTVGFDGGDGDLYRIEWYEMTSDQETKLKNFEMQRPMLEMVRSRELQMFRSFSPKVTIEHEEITGEGEQAQKFFVLHASQAANVEDSENRSDSTRGFLIFIRQKWIYALSIQDTAPFYAKTEPPETRNARLKAELEKFSQTINFS